MPDPAAISSITWSSDGKPFSVECGTDYIKTYDVDWCKRDQALYYHWSGSGPETKNYTDNGLNKLPEGITTFDQLIEHLDMAEEETSYCRICDDRLPDGALCDHLHWDDEEGMVAGRGAQDA